MTRLPKGTIEKSESVKNAAAREVYEETGVKAEIVEKIGDIKFFFILKDERIFKQVTLIFPEAEKEIAEVKW